MIRRLTSHNLRVKLFFSHLLVTLVAGLTFAVAALGISVILQPTAGAFERTFLYLILAALLTAVVALVTSLFVAGRIITPLRNMLSATRRISTGSYDERVPVVEEDEIGELSDEFNSMAAALEEGERRRREFITDVSHELGTPISTLQGYMEGLMDGVVEPSEETWGLLYSETERMRRLVDDLRQLSRLESGQLELKVAPVPIADPVRTSTEAMQPLFAEKGVKLENLVPPHAPFAAADSDRMVQVLTNLLTNALRHTPSGGEVTVEGESLESSVVLRVSDDGSGIPEGDLPHLFERFYRVEKSRSRGSGGSGVGLAIARALVEAMGGTIRAESGGPGTGAVFVIQLARARKGQGPGSES